MRAVFADTSYWFAFANPRDGLHDLAKAMVGRLGPHRLVTSEMVLAELLNAMCDLGPHLRSNAAGLTGRIIADPAIELVAQTPVLFRRALALYRERADKTWSLTDCASFVIMDERQITEALTHDRHFEQNGYRALLRG